MNVPKFFAGPINQTYTPERDWSSRAGAQALADKIVEVWRKAGYHDVTAEVIPVKRSVTGAVIHYGVKTNLINGMPA